VTACPQPCTVWGDLSKPATLTITQRMPDGGAEDLGSALVLQVPPQGGHVAYIGARVENFEGCRLELVASLYPPDSGLLATEERRRVDLTVNGGSDPSDPANFANVPVCPNYGTRDFPGLAWTLVVEAKQRDGRTVSATRTVVPTCAFGASFCQCECSSGYEFGKCEGHDGGADGGVDGG
jgi:hypothetical protein